MESERGEKPLKWFQKWWGIAALGILGSAAPQLCPLLPNPVASTVCGVIVKVAVSTFSAPSVALPSPTAVPAAECPSERLLSNGYCMPVAVPAVPNP